MLSPAETYNVAVLGAAGYVGGELLRLLALHPHVASLKAYSDSHAGRPWAEAHPTLAHVRPAAFEPFDAAAAARDADVVFLALPHGKSATCLPTLLDGHAHTIIDLAADFRVQDRSLYEAYYGPHPCFEHAGRFVYGLADVLGQALCGRHYIAAPGCFATAALLCLYPLASRQLLDGPAVVFGITGSSGAGASPKRTTHHPVRAHNFFAYSLDGHRHEAEIRDQLTRWSGAAPADMRLLTHSAPLVRGIHATLHARLSRPVRDPHALLAETYAGRPFIRVQDVPPELTAVVGSNFAHLHAAARQDGHEIVITSVIDNLIKGAAGQAIQAFNLALGLPEDRGLDQPGLYPC